MLRKITNNKTVIAKIKQNSNFFISPSKLVVILKLVVHKLSLAAKSTFGRSRLTT